MYCESAQISITKSDNDNRPPVIALVTFNVRALKIDVFSSPEELTRVML